MKFHLNLDLPPKIFVDKIGISKTTFSCLIESARKKIVDALLHIQALKILKEDEL